MQLKVMFLLFILVFYSSVTLFYGFYGDLVNDSVTIEKQNVDENKLGWFQRASGNDTTGFFKDVVTGFSDVPVWINILVFAPLSLALLYLLLPTY